MSEQLSYFQRMQKIKLGLLPKEAVAKPKKAIPKISEKKKAEMKKEKEERGGEDSTLVKWFKERIKYSMKGVCEETGLRTETGIYKYAIMSCCHILPKRLCKSVMYHPLNFIELLPDKHHEFDSISWEERETWGCWPIVRDRLVMIYPDLNPSEHRHFPQSVIDYINKNEPF